MRLVVMLFIDTTLSPEEILHFEASFALLVLRADELDSPLLDHVPKFSLVLKLPHWWVRFEICVALDIFRLQIEKWEGCPDLH